MVEKTYYTNELPPKEAMITIHDAMSSLSPEMVARANEQGIIPECDLHYFEVSWMAKRRGVGTVIYIHRYYFSSYKEARDGQYAFERIMQGNTKDFVDVYYMLRLQDTQDKLAKVRYNRQKAREWEKYLVEHVDDDK